MSTELKIMGSVEISAGGRSIPIRGVKPRQLLVALALNPNTVIPVDRLIDALWPQGVPRSVHENLRTYATALRRAFSPDGPSLITSGEGYKLVVDERNVDASVFSARLRSARQALDDGDLTERAARLTEALALWRGRAAEGLPRESWLGNALAALEAQRLFAHEERAEVWLALGRHVELVPELVRLLAEHPLRERLWQQLMLAHYRCGNTGAALQTFAQARAVLAAELGIDPGDTLSELYRAILRRDPALGRTSPAPAPRQIPVPAGPLVGREDELLRLAGILREARHTCARVTISGPPGAGKSVLAQRAAHVVAEHFPDGQLYIDFRALGQPTDTGGLLAVATGLLRSLGIADAAAADFSSACARLRGHLAGRRVLILMDNAVSAAQVVPFLPPRLGSAAVITSPQLLASADIAHHLEVGPLSRAAGIELFDSVVGPARTRDDPAAVATVAELCGDLPAALRMAGLRLVCRPDWTVSELRDRLQSTPNLFDELRGGGRSLRSTYATALAELTMVDTEAAQALSRFAVSGVAPAGAESVRLLETLADFHLLEAPSPGLFKVPRLVRELTAFSSPSPDDPQHRARRDRSKVP